MSRILTSSIIMATMLLLSGQAGASSTVTRTSSFAYDAASGLLIQEKVEPDTPSLRLQTDYTYDQFGNRVSATASGVDIVTRNALSGYDAKGQFNSSNTNALGQSESWQYDPRFGSPASQTGPNGLATTWSYDGFGRKIGEVRPDGTRTKWVYSFCSGINGGTASCPTGAGYLVQALSLAADGATANGPSKTVYFDSLDREIVYDTQGFDGSTIRVATTYDALGRVTKTSRPYFVNGGTPQYTTATYDTLGRELTRTKPDGGVAQVAYHGLTTTTTNPLGQIRSVTRNSQGNEVSVTDAIGKTMTFAYDGFGSVLQAADPVGNVVTATYDARGNKVGSVDPDMGASSYTYNVLGQLVSQTDAKGQIITVTYDKLDRVAQRVELGMTSIWTYDTAVHGIGKLASSSITSGPGAGFARSATYDALGRPQQVSTTIDGVSYVMGATYDANGRVSKVSYPSGFTARYNYSALGDVSQLVDDATSQSFWTANAMDADLHLTQQTAGNGIVTVNSFDGATGRLTGIAAGSGNAVQNLAVTYDKRGNPLSRSDANTNLSETFAYDALSRLTSSTVNLTPTPLAKTFSYSPIGNMLSKSDVGNYSYPAPGSPLPHAVTSISDGLISTTFTYDANGNQTSGFGRSITYTSYDKPASITQGTRTISFLDDTEHQRFKQVTPEGATLYISAFGVQAELNNPGTSSARWIEYLSVGGTAIGLRSVQAASETVTTRYLHTDHLGSISVITNENGAVLERLSYDAWGKRRNPNGTDDATGGLTSQTTRGFTGEEQLSVAGLVHLNGRVYDPRLARMTSADPTVPKPMNTQSWNRYSYVSNRPLKYTDPSGYEDLVRVPIYGGYYDPTAVCGYGCYSSGGLGYGNSGGTSNASLFAPYYAGPSLSTQIANSNAANNAFTSQTLNQLSAQNASINANNAALAAMQASMPMLPPLPIAPVYPPSTVASALSAPAAASSSPASPTLHNTSWNAVDALHGVLAVASFAPSFLGSAAAFVDGLLYLGQGDLTNGGISIAAAGLGLASDAGLARLGLKATQAGVDALRSAGQLGRQGEQAVRGAFEIGGKRLIEVNGRNRIPDGLTVGVISEVKNVNRLSFTRQLRDYVDYAQVQGIRFDLYTRRTTEISGPLKNAIEAGIINHLYIP